MNKRALTLKQKKEVIVRLYRLWKKNPEMRLTQLIENVFHHDKNCIYHIEDFELVEALEHHYESPVSQLPN